ncbi:hypothetical protein [Prosthecodimorpha staleyi]|uniref:Uncharacterized protein n=1 Tax=Prosthecodimorpha staleyi TaxID=2840188 RepID=A0A947G9Q6_9HYPH|nr:hypothetical protein [Prosthecodimorpha staleyi]MBT9288213.1 hypothetical protein [Prosthecodimorpha staleyi]
MAITLQALKQAVVGTDGTLGLGNEKGKGKLIVVRSNTGFFGRIAEMMQPKKEQAAVKSEVVKTLKSAYPGLGSHIDDTIGGLKGKPLTARVVRDLIKMGEFGNKADGLGPVTQDGGQVDLLGSRRRQPEGQVQQGSGEQVDSQNQGGHVPGSEQGIGHSGQVGQGGNVQTQGTERTDGTRTPPKTDSSKVRAGGFASVDEMREAATRFLKNGGLEGRSSEKLKDFARCINNRNDCDALLSVAKFGRDGLKYAMAMAEDTALTTAYTKAQNSPEWAKAKSDLQKNNPEKYALYSARQFGSEALALVGQAHIGLSESLGHVSDVLKDHKAGTLDRTAAGQRMQQVCKEQVASLNKRLDQIDANIAMLRDPEFLQGLNEEQLQSVLDMITKLMSMKTAMLDKNGPYQEVYALFALGTTEPLALLDNLDNAYSNSGQVDQIVPDWTSKPPPVSQQSGSSSQVPTYTTEQALKFNAVDLGKPGAPDAYLKAHGIKMTDGEGNALPPQQIMRIAVDTLNMHTLLGQMNFDLGRAKRELTENQFATVTRSLDRIRQGVTDELITGNPDLNFKVVTTDTTITFEATGTNPFDGDAAKRRFDERMDKLFTETTNPFGIDAEALFGRQIGSK